MDHRVIGVVLQVVDLYLDDLDVQVVQDVLEEVMGHGSRRLHVLKGGRNARRFQQPDPDGQNLLLFQVLQDHDRCIRERVDGDACDFHFLQHIMPPSISALRREGNWRTPLRSPALPALPTMGAGPRKFTIRFVLVLPASSSGEFLLAPSTSTSILEPSIP